MRVIIVEPSAVDFDRTHSAKSIEGHSRALGSAGIDIIWVTNEDSRLSRENTINHKVIPYTIYDDVRNGQTGIKRITRFFYYRDLVQATCARLREVLDQQKVSSADHLFVPTADWIMLRAIHQLAKDAEFQNRFPVLHILVMYENANWMTGGYPYRRLVRLLRDFDSPIYLYTETGRHAKRLSATLGLKVSGYPFPCFAEENVLSDNKKELNVCFLGGGRKDKGYQLIPGIVSLLGRSEPKQEIRFTIQSPRPEDGLDEELEALKRHDNVLVMDNCISDSAFREAVVECSIMVFPYQQKIYHARGSAIVNEAVANGIPFVCTRNTSLEEMLAEGNGSDASGEEEFSMAIATIIDNYERYRKNATRMAGVYQARLLDSALIRNILAADSGKLENC